MDRRKIVAYWKALSSNIIDHGDILAFRLIPIMRWFVNTSFCALNLPKSQIISVNFVYGGLRRTTRRYQLVRNFCTSYFAYTKYYRFAATSFTARDTHKANQWPSWYKTSVIAWLDWLRVALHFYFRTIGSALRTSLRQSTTWIGTF